MKRIITLILAIIMVMSLWVPTFAIERDPNTDELCETFQLEDNKFEYKPVGGYGHGKWHGDIFYMYADVVEIPEGIWGGTDIEYIDITPNEGMDVTITRIEAKISSILYYYGVDFANVGISDGNKEQTGYIDNGSWVTISDINSKEFSFSGGKDDIAFEIIKVYYTCATHNWSEAGICKLCDAQICETTGEHTWDDNGHCVYCKKFLCDETGDHIWKDNGHCQYCDALKCEVTGQHDHTTEVKIPAYIVKHNCDYCGETVSEEVVEANNNTASIFGNGNVLIISGIVCVLLGLCGGYLLGAKKKTE